MKRRHLHDHIALTSKLLVFGLVVIGALVVNTRAGAAVNRYELPPASDPNPPPAGPFPEDLFEMGEPEDEGSPESEEETGKDSSETTVTNIQTNEYYFDTTSWLDALLHTLTKDSSKSVSKFQPALKTIALSAFQYMLDFDTDGLEGVKGGSLIEPAKKIWRVSFGVALALFPLVMVVNIFLTYSQGLGAGSARAEMVQNLVEGMVLLGFAWGSYILVNYIISIGWGLASFILDAKIAASVGGKYAVVEQLVTRIVVMYTSNVFGLVYFYLLVFFLIFAFMLLGALSLSYYAIIVVAVMCLAIAPVMIVLGGIPQFRWLYGFWMKILSGVLILPVFNALMIRLWGVLARPAALSGLGGSIMSVVTSLGLLSILITINGKVGQLTFGPALDAARKAGRATLSVAKLMVSAVALIAGAPSAAGAVMNTGGGRGGGGFLAAGDGPISGGGGEGGGSAHNGSGQAQPAAQSPESALGTGAQMTENVQNRRGNVTVFDMIARPGKVAKAAANSDISPAQMNRMAVAGNLVEAMWRNDPAMRTLTAPMRQGIDTAVQEERKLDQRAWSTAQDIVRETRRAAKSASGHHQADGDLHNTLLNHTNPRAVSLYVPDGFNEYYRGVSQTATGLQAEMAAAGISFSDGIPDQVSATQFMGSLATLLNSGTALPPDLEALRSEHGQTPLTPGVAKSILNTAYEPGSGAFHTVNAALKTIQDIDTGAIQLTRQEIQSQFGKNLRQSQSEH